MENEDKRDHHDISLVNSSDLNSLKLELHTPADFGTLAVFIRDPENPKQYWHRSINVESRVDTSSGKFGPEHTNISVNNMHEFDLIPCPEEHLRIALHHMKSYREKDENDPNHVGMESAVGVSVYEGEKQLPFKAIVNLVGAKYGMMRQEYLARQN